MTDRPKSHLGKWLIVWSILVAGAAGGGWWYWQRGREAKSDYQTATVVRGDLTQAVTASGRLNPVLNVQVGSQISGIILKLYADFNSPVKAGQLIAQLDPATFQANVNSAEGELANARASLEFAQVDARRAQALYKDKLIPETDYQRAEATLHQAEAQVKIREASLERAKVDLARCTIYAPVDGVVISRNVDVGQTVAASLSAPTLFLIANDLSKMQIDANVAEADVGVVEVGQEVDFTVDAFPYQTFRGNVVQVRNSPIVVQNVVTYDTVIAVSNPDLKLKPGMTANVSIIIQHRQNALRIPNAALRFRPPEAASAIGAGGGSPVVSQTTGEGRGRGNGEAGGPGGRRGRGGRGGGGGRQQGERQFNRTVHVLAGPEATAQVLGKLRPVQVRVGISDGILTEVTEGLKEGDVVVTGLSTPVLPVGQGQGQRPSNPLGGGGRGFGRF